MLFRARPIAFVFFCLSVSLLPAQYVPQLPIPHRRKSQPVAGQSPTLESQGKVQSLISTKLVVESEDGRTFTLALNSTTTFSRNGASISASTILPGATVHFEAAIDKDDNLTATKVDLLKDPPKESASAPPAATSTAQPSSTPPAESEPEPTIRKSSIDAPGRPILHHGTSRERTGPAPSDSDDVASNGPTVTKSPTGAPIYKDGDITVEPDAPPQSASSGPTPAAPPSLIARARDWVNTFTDSLPNYVCRQSTTRYQEMSKREGWQALDVVSAEVVYEDRKESYRNIEVGGKKTSKSMDEIGGATSTGEFASILKSLFAPQTDAAFRFAQSARIGPTEASVYDFKVDLHRSGWQIHVGGQNLRPAYSGSVWIDKKTAEVRRIEMQADKIPTDFPFDSIETAVDYDKVMLGTNAFFLPVHSENLACQRGTTICSKNTIDFRNYHRFAGESTIEFGK